MVKRLKRRGPVLPKPVDPNEVEAALARIKSAVSEEDYAVLRAIVDAEPQVRAQLLAMQADEAHLRKLLKRRGVRAP
jgi:hypothetical protein